jgi:hypothetical protein
MVQAQLRRFAETTNILHAALHELGHAIGGFGDHAVVEGRIVVFAAARAINVSVGETASTVLRLERRNRRDAILRNTTDCTRGRRPSDAAALVGRLVTVDGRDSAAENLVKADTLAFAALCLESRRSPEVLIEIQRVLVLGENEEGAILDATTNVNPTRFSWVGFNAGVVEALSREIYIEGVDAFSNALEVGHQDGRDLVYSLKEMRTRKGEKQW